MTQPIFILAGEPSGDQIAAKIMSAINSAYGQQDWFGMGGQKMKDLGLRNEADMDQLSIIGFGAAIKAYPNLSRLADR
ncbi:MAG: lipid-A-disaccharide synthase, partial [Candidatus Puniceispirillum sp.]